MVEWQVELTEATWARHGGRSAVEGLVHRAGDACDAVLRSEGHEAWILALTVTTSQRVRSLNRVYRGIDRTTDVLSFSQREGEDMPAPPGAPLVLGDVIVSLEVAARQARVFRHSLARELAFLCVHGTLHLLGYDHEVPADETVMMGKAERALASLGLTRDA